MNITFILPAIGKKKNEKYLKSWLMEPLTIAVLNKLTPKAYSRSFYDDRIEAIDYDADTDVVVLPVETYTAKRAYEIAAQFHKRNKLVIMGGYHVTLLPEEASAHSDIIVKGNAETIWAKILTDIAHNCWQPEYEGNVSLDYGIPDRSIYQDKMGKYLPISLVEVGRGCRHHCDFCSIHAYYQGQYHHRTIEDIIGEIKQCAHNIFFFVDDSIFSDKAFAKALFIEVAKLNITWTTQITLDIARDEDLLQLMKKSGCEMILIGFESIDPKNLAQMNKSWSLKLGERDQLVERIHLNGISIYASFVFGFDYDNEQSFINNLEFCKKHHFFITAFNHLLTFPNTPIYQRFQAEERLCHDAWWMSAGYTFGTISFEPKLLSREELRSLCRKYKTKFFAYAAILRRGIILMKRTRRLRIIFAYWVMNILFHFEVDKRFGIPVGSNLDETKK